MGSTYDGIAANIVFPAAINISSSTNASPISVTTSTPHNLQTGDQASITGHQVNTNANGAALTITRTGASTFTINGSTGNGIGGATGTVQPLTYGGATTLPSDGDARNAASVNVPFQSTLDRTQKILPALPYVKLAGRAILTNGFGPSNNWATISANVGAATWKQFTADATLAVLSAPTGSLTVASVATATNPAVYSFSGVQGSDLIFVSLETNVNFAGNADHLGLWYAITAPGAAAPALGSYSLITGNSRAGSSTTMGVRISGWLPNIGEGTLWLTLQYYTVAAASPLVVSVTDDTVLTVEAWRATGVPQ